MYYQRNLLILALILLLLFINTYASHHQSKHQSATSPRSIDRKSKSPKSVKHQVESALKGKSPSHEPKKAKVLGFNECMLNIKKDKVKRSWSRREQESYCKHTSGGKQSSSSHSPKKPKDDSPLHESKKGPSHEPKKAKALGFDECMQNIRKDKVKKGWSRRQQESFCKHTDAHAGSIKDSGSSSSSSSPVFGDDKQHDILYVCGTNDVYKIWPLPDTGETLDVTDTPLDALDLNALKAIPGTDVCMPLVPGGDVTKEPVTKSKGPDGKGKCFTETKALGGGHNMVYDFEFIKKKIGGAHLLKTIAGDYLSPSYMSLNDQFSTRGGHLTELMAMVRYDIGAIGNHEFDKGAGALLKSFDHTTCPILANNLFWDVYDADESRKRKLPTDIIELGKQIEALKGKVGAKETEKDKHEKRIKYHTDKINELRMEIGHKMTPGIKKLTLKQKKIRISQHEDQIATLKKKKVDVEANLAPLKAQKDILDAKLKKLKGDHGKNKRGDKSYIFGSEIPAKSHAKTSMVDKKLIKSFKAHDSLFQETYDVFRNYESCGAVPPANNGKHNKRAAGTCGDPRINSEYIRSHYKTSDGTPAKVCTFAVTEHTAAMSSANKKLFDAKEQAFRVIFDEETIKPALRTIRHLRKQEKCDVIICIGHTGISTDRKILTKSFIEAKEDNDRGCDLFLSGHDHFPVIAQHRFDMQTKTSDPKPKLPKGSGPNFAKWGADAKFIGCAEINLKKQVEFKRGTGKTWKKKHPPVIKFKIVDVDTAAPRRPWVKDQDRSKGVMEQLQLGKDMDLKNPHKDYLKAQQAMLSMKYWDKYSKSDVLRSEQCGVGFKGVYDTAGARKYEGRALNMQVDLIRYFLKSDIGIFQGGSIRGDLKSPAGNELNKLTFAEEHPWSGDAGEVELKGQQLRDIAERVKRLGEDENWTHISGMTAFFIFDRSEPDEKKKIKITYLFHNPNQMYGRDYADNEYGLPHAPVKAMWCKTNPGDEFKQDHPTLAAKIKQLCEAAKPDEDIYRVAAGKFSLTPPAPTQKKGTWAISVPKGKILGTPGWYVKDIAFAACKGEQIKPTNLAGCGDSTCETETKPGFQKPQHIGNEDGNDPTINMNSLHARFNQDGKDEQVKALKRLLKVTGTGFIEKSDKILSSVPLYYSTTIRNIADEILSRYVQPNFLENNQNDLYTSIKGNDIEAFVEESIEYGFPKEKKEWLTHYVTNAARLARHDHSGLASFTSHVKNLHPRLHHLL